MMRHFLWAFSAVLLFALTCLLVAWPSLQDLYRDRALRPVAAEGNAGIVSGVTIRVSTATAMILPQQPDRALIYLRLDLSGDPAAMSEWLSCNVSLRDSQGRRWRALYSPLGLKIIDLLGGQKAAGKSCQQALFAGEDNALADEAFLLPVDIMGDLRLDIHGEGTLPYTLSLPIRPVLRLAF